MSHLRRLLQPLRSQINHRFGIDVVRTDGHHHRDAHIKRIFRDYQIDAVLDVGANVGQFGQLVRKLGFEGDIHSFEPVKETYGALLKAIAGDNQWHAYPVALGNEAGKSIINVMESSGLSSILSPNDLGHDTWKEMKTIRQQEVLLETLDQFIPDHLTRNSNRIFLKMDTQGYDLRVFEGARQSLARIASVMSELSLAPIYYAMPDYLEVLAFYQKNGFSVSGVYPILRSFDLALIEADCVLVNKAMFRS